MKSVKKFQRGSALLIIIAVISVTVLLLLVAGILFVSNPQSFLNSYFKQLTNKEVTLSSTVPFEQWISYESLDPKFTVKYPTDWVYSVSGQNNSDHLLSVSFYPDSENKRDKLNGVIIRVFDRKNASTLDDWVSQYASLSDNEALAAKENDHSHF